MLVCTLSSFIDTFIFGAVAGVIGLIGVFAIWLFIENKRYERKKKNA